MKRLIVIITLFLALAAQVGATPITFNATDGTRSASATFDTSGSNLIVALTNTSTSDVTVPIHVLTGMFFTISGDPTLTPVSALLNTGSVVVFGPNGGGNVGGEWGYNDGLSGAPGGADEGISSSGLGLFGPSDLFPGANLQGPLSPDGLQYGITSAGDDTSSGNAAVTGNFALIKNSVVFTLSGLSTGFDPSAAGAITNVSFQYGTDLTEPNITPPNGQVPEPSTLLLLGSGLVGFGLFCRRRKR